MLPAAQIHERRFRHVLMEEEEKAPSTPKQSLKREQQYDSAPQDSARGLRVANKKAPRRDVVLGSGGNRAAAGVVTNLGASLAKVQRDTPRSSGRDATGTFEEMLPPPAEEAVAAAYRGIGLRENLSAAVEAVVNGMRSLWSSATRQKDRIFARKAEEEAVDWARLTVEDQVLIVRAADKAIAGTKAYEKKVKTLSKAKIAKFDAADAALAGYRGRLVTAATKKGDKVVLACGVSGTLTKDPKSGNYSVKLDGYVEGKGGKDDVKNFRTSEIDVKYVAPAHVEMQRGPCGQVDVRIKTTTPTRAILDDYGRRLAAARANAEKIAFVEAAGELYDGGHEVFVANCKAAASRTQKLVVIRERALLLSCIPKKAITKDRCVLIAREAGAGYTWGPREGFKGDGTWLMCDWPGHIMNKAEKELDEKPPEERLAEFFRRRKLHLQREKPKEEVELFNEQKAKASPTTLSYTLTVPRFNKATFDEAERAFNVAEAARKGRRHPVASARWLLPLDPTMKLAPPANRDALRKCKKYLVLTDEVEFEELGDFVKRLEHGAKRKPHLYPVS